MTISHGGKTYDEADLLPVGDRVNPNIIASGLMKEITVNFNGEERHLPLFTAAGMANIKAEYEAEGIRGEEPNRPSDPQPQDTFIIVDDNGMPTATMDVGKIQEDAVDLVFSLAAHCGDEAKTEAILAEQVHRHTTRGLSLVFIAALKSMTNDILAGAFDVMEATGADPRAKMAEIAAVKMPK